MNDLQGEVLKLMAAQMEVLKLMCAPPIFIQRGDEVERLKAGTVVVNHQCTGGIGCPGCRSSHS